MAQLDANIFLQQKGPDLGQISEGFDRGIRLGDMMRQRKIQDLEIQKQNDIKEAYNNAYDVKEDGSRVLNPMKLSDLVRQKGYGQEAYKIDQDMKAQQAVSLKNDLDNKYNEANYIVSELNTVKDLPTLIAAKARAKQRGIQGVDQIPDVYDQKLIDGLKGQFGNASLTYEKQLIDQRQREETAQKVAQLGFENNIKLRQVGLDEQKIKNEMGKGEGLPLDSKKVIETLATKNANRISAINQLESALSTMKDKSENEKLEAYRKTFKILNSPDNPDAVGTEEASRIGGKLDFAKGNFTNNNPIQWGRDIKGFETDLENYIETLKSGLAKNQNEIASMKSGRTSGEVKIKKEDMPKPVQMRDPNGNIRMIPFDQVEAAKAAGGVPL